MNDLETSQRQTFLRFLGSRLRDIRLQQGLSQEEIGVLLSKSQQSVANYESGLAEISHYSLYRLCRAFQMPVDYFYGDAAAYDTEADHSPLGIKLTRLRLSAGAPSLKDMARDLNLAPAQLSNWELGAEVPDTNQLRALARYFKVRPSYLGLTAEDLDEATLLSPDLALLLRRVDDLDPGDRDALVRLIRLVLDGSAKRRLNHD